ncbi:MULTISPECIES: hypothetical protein [unclassified Curtobacterium]|uniref:hypothetical protein n=1 Tax=unclassified Curtobacterium TaxID=257496 RepID=UPI0015E8B835|nr:MULTISPECIES: hypothetical protein [unclassified Curtobacterium]
MLLMPKRKRKRKNQRDKTRNSQRRARTSRASAPQSGGQEVDVHGAAIAESVHRQLELMDDLETFDNQLDEVDRRIDGILTELMAQLSSHRAERVVELARLACLPWSAAGQVKVDVEGGVTKAEILALLALSSDTAVSFGSPEKEEANSLYEAAHGWAARVGEVIELAQARQMIVDREKATSDIDSLSFMTQSASVWIRSTSYPDMVKPTYLALFGGVEVRSALRANFGFDADEAIRVLESLHALQVEAMNDRVEIYLRAMASAYGDAQNGQSMPDETNKLRLRALHNRAWQPSADSVAFSPERVALAAGVEETVARAVLDHFAPDTGSATPREILDAFVGGDNELRTNPVIRTRLGGYLLVHDALVLPAIRENLEQELKGLPVWEVYQSERGALLEDLGEKAFRDLLPKATIFKAFDYFVPKDESEEGLDPAQYTKKVEGDLFLTLDDVAIIVEAKAVAISPESRSGDTRRLRRDLTGIISKATSQASRLKLRIENDRGIRLHQTGWMDLANIREIHIVALSLEDLSGVPSAMSELISAGMLVESDIPWVISVHDLQVIGRVVDRPAEFLLYLRRRRQLEIAKTYMASDELDLFLYFYEEGLYVGPVPQAVGVGTGDEEQPAEGQNGQRMYITSRTDPLDAWHYATLADPKARIAKPRIAGSPMTSFVDAVERFGSFGWLSIGATLLSADTSIQSELVQVPRKLQTAPDSKIKGHSFTATIGGSTTDGWVFAWMTVPAEGDVSAEVELARRYIKAKKYQLGLRRAAAFIFDHQGENPVGIVYDGEIPIADPAMEEEIARLFPLPGGSAA